MQCSAMCCGAPPTSTKLVEASEGRRLVKGDDRPCWGQDEGSVTEYRGSTEEEEMKAEETVRHEEVVGAIQRSRECNSSWENATDRLPTTKANGGSVPFKEWNVDWSRNDGHTLGLGVSRHEEFLVVRELHVGISSAWNQKHPDRRICLGDLIVEINGESGDSTRLHALLAGERSLRLRFRRLLEFTAVLEPGDPLGLRMNSNDRILEVEEGAVQAYNKVCPPGRMVFPGNRVAQVTLGAKTTMLVQRDQ